MAIGDIWRFAFEGVLLGQSYVNVFHIKFLSVGATPAGATGIIDTDLYSLYVAARCTNDFHFSGIHGRQLAVPAPTYDGAYSLAGGVSTDNLPPQSALVATLRTGYAGRTKRGRLYLGGFSEALQVDGQWDASFVAAMQTYFDDMVAALGLGGSNTDYQWGVWSRKLGGEDPGPYNLAAGWTPISSVVVRPIVYTQRRRTIGVGA